MKVFILTEGGKNIGFGHVTRCISLFQAFEEQGIIPMLIINGEEMQGVLGGREHLALNWLQQKEGLCSILKNAQIVIVDSYLAGVHFYGEILESAEMCVYMDDNKRVSYPRGIVVNGNIYAKDLDYPHNNSISYLLGPQYLPLRKEFWEVPQKTIEQKVSSVMITFGGDDSRGITQKILSFLKEKQPSLKKKVIIGRAFKDKDAISKEADSNTELIYCPGAEEMKVAMLSSSLAISAGGQTLYELACVGTPTIAIVTSDNQLNNVVGWAEVGFVKNAGWWDEDSLYEKVDSCIQEFIDIKERIASSERGRNLVKGSGARLVVESILREKESLIK